MEPIFDLRSNQQLDSERTRLVFPQEFLSIELRNFAECIACLVELEEIRDTSEFLFWLANRPTLSAIWATSHRVDWTLRAVEIAVHLKLIDLQKPEAFRQFACWSAETIREPHYNWDKVFNATQSYLKGKISLTELRNLQQRTHPAGAGVCGLPRCSAYAAWQLASWHTADHSPLQAAYVASNFAVLGARFKAAEEGARVANLRERFKGTWRESYANKFFYEAHPEVVEAAGALAQQQHARELVKLVGNPFLQVDSARLSFLTSNIHHVAHRAVYNQEGQFN